jgi:hypothetical protein
MIDSAVILNYKSAKDIQLSCRKLNIFIGPPNTGKSNILEALGLFSLFNNECKITELARFQTMHNLFYDNNIDNPIHVRTNTHRLKIQYKENFEVDIETRTETAIKSYELFYDQTGKLLNSHPHYVSPVNLYKFKPENTFANKNTSHLKPPYGDNLVLMLMKHANIRREASEVFGRFGYKMGINPLDSSINIQKENDGIIIAQPYTLSSYMMQRYVFHMAAIETNKNGIIIFEEPESYASSDFLNRIIGKIASSENNQFFISSHNTNLLISALSQMPAEDVKIYYCLYDNYQTKVKALIEEDYDDIMKKDIGIMSRLESKLAERI